MHKLEFLITVCFFSVLMGKRAWIGVLSGSTYCAKMAHLTPKKGNLPNLLLKKKKRLDNQLDVPGPLILSLAFSCPVQTSELKYKKCKVYKERECNHSLFVP